MKDILAMINHNLILPVGTKLFYSTLLLVIIASCSDSERSTKPKIEFFENPLVQESLENHVIPIINSFEIEKLKELGFAPPYIFDKNLFRERYGIRVLGYTQQTKLEMDLGYMRGTVILSGSSYNKKFEYWQMESVSLGFVKLSKNEPWKLITYDGHIEDFKSQMQDDPDLVKVIWIVPPEIQIYIKSKFKTISSRDFILSSSMKKILSDYKGKTQ